MTTHPLTVRVSDHAQFKLSNMSDDERRRVEAWFGHLRNWRDDGDLRAHVSRPNQADDVYMLRTTDGFVIPFRLAGDEAVVLSLFSEDTVNRFRAPTHP